MQDRKPTPDIYEHFELLFFLSKPSKRRIHEPVSTEKDFEIVFNREFDKSGLKNTAKEKTRFAGQLIQETNRLIKLHENKALRYRNQKVLSAADDFKTWLSTHFKSNSKADLQSGKYKTSIERNNDKVMQQHNYNLDAIDTTNKKKRKKSDNEEVNGEVLYNDFDDLFKDKMKENPELIKACYKVLEEEEIINNTNQFIKRPPGNIIIWYRVLLLNGLIDRLDKNNDKIVIDLIKKKFKISKLHDRALSDKHTRAENNYKELFKRMVPKAPPSS